VFLSYILRPVEKTLSHGRHWISVAQIAIRTSVVSECPRLISNSLLKRCRECGCWDQLQLSLPPFGSIFKVCLPQWCCGNEERLCPEVELERISELFFSNFVRYVAWRSSTRGLSQIWLQVREEWKYHLRVEWKFHCQGPVQTFGFSKGFSPLRPINQFIIIY
jgi:hypothetical protein